MPDAAPNPRMFFTELVDAVRYAENWAESIEKERGARDSTAKQIQELEKLVLRISASFDGLGLDPEYHANLSKVIGEFTAAATKQAREKIESKLKATMEELSAESNSERLKTVKSLESYLSVTPIPVLEEEISLELSDGSYAADARYTCPEEIEYGFLLNTANSNLFRSQFSLDAFRKGARIPVRLAKTWIKKQPVPDYEKLEDFYLSKALASKNHITARFERAETGGSVNIVYSKSNSESFVTVEYYDRNGKVDVTGEPALNKHLDVVFLKESMDKLLEAISILNKDKLKLAKLEYDGVNVLETMNCLGFMQQVVKVLVQSRDSMEAIRKLDPKESTERLKMLGKNGAGVSESLGLAQPRAKGR